MDKMQRTQGGGQVIDPIKMIQTEILDIFRQTPEVGISSFQVADKLARRYPIRSVQQVIGTLVDAGKLGFSKHRYVLKSPAK